MKAKLLSYKGYVGSVEYSEDDSCFYGKVLGIRSLILYEGPNLGALEKDFKDGIDNYLEDCLLNGEEPEKPSL